MYLIPLISFPLAIVLLAAQVTAGAPVTILSPEASSGASYHGKVVDKRGNAVGGISVGLRIKNANSPSYTTIASSDGRFFFHDVAPRLYQLSFSSQTLPFVDCSSQLFNCSLRELDLRTANDSQEMTETLDTSAALLVGDIVKAESGTPISEQVYLAIRRGDNYYRVTSYPVRSHFALQVPANTDLVLTLFSDAYRFWTYRDPDDRFASMRLDPVSTKTLRITVEALGPS
jgi:hypothetical protein